MTSSITCTYIGHATTAIEMEGLRLYTDPHFGRRTLVWRRQVELPFTPAERPDANLLLVSHGHYDHLDQGSFRFFSSDIPVVIPEYTARYLAPFVRNPVIELAHWATHTFHDGTSVTAVPLLHKGGRLLPLRAAAMNGYIVTRKDRTIFFCGDSGYGDHFKKIGELYSIDLALLPISGYAPRFWMRFKHMAPEETLQAFADLGAKAMVPIHWGTFHFSGEPLQQPIGRLKRAIADSEELRARVHILDPGASCTL